MTAAIMSQTGTAAGFGRIARHVVELADGRAAFLDRGRGPAAPLLLVHGFGGDALSWQFNLSVLARERRVIAVDLPGHGGSTRDVGRGDAAALCGWLVRLLDALEVPVVEAVGHSLGGKLALALACREPGRVSRVSLLAPAGFGAAVDLQLLHRLVRVDGLAAGLAVVDGLFAAPSPLREPMARALANFLARPGAREPLATILAASDAILAAPPSRLAEVGVPIQAIWGVRDTVVPPPGSAWPATVPLHLLSGVGHLPHAEAAGAVNRLLLDFHSTSIHSGDGTKI